MYVYHDSKSLKLNKKQLIHVCNLILAQKSIARDKYYFKERILYKCFSFCNILRKIHHRGPLYEICSIFNNIIY